MYNLVINERKRLVFGALMMISGFSQSSELIFEENFGGQEDWTSAMYSDDRTQRAETHTIPNGWYSVRQDPSWAPSVGHPDRHEAIEILSSNSDKALSDGKSYVSWRDSYNPGWNRWNSESIISKYFPEGHDELYVEFWISFSEDWTRVASSAANSKIFRISSWDGSGSNEYNFFGGGNNGPIAQWNHSINQYGVRNRITFRGGPHGNNYTFDDQDISGLPRSLSGAGDLSLNFSNNVAGMAPDGTDPQIPDKRDGGYLPASGTIDHDQVFGPGRSWTKIGIYVRMNSDPDTRDGVFRQWVDDVQVFQSENIPWIRSSENEDVGAKWNIVMFGGNDYFQTYPNEDRHEEWYSIDNIRIYNGMPNAPKEPTNVTVTVD